MAPSAARCSPQRVLEVLRTPPVQPQVNPDGRYGHNRWPQPMTEMQSSPLLGNCTVGFPECSQSCKTAVGCRLGFSRQIPPLRTYPRTKHTGMLSCAVVGSDESLLGSECGSHIDAHDIVLRINSPVVAGFERDVGHKTDIMLMNLGISQHVMNISFRIPMRRGYTRRLTAYGGSLLLLLPRLDLLRSDLTWTKLAYDATHIVGEVPQFRREVNNWWGNLLRSHKNSSLGRIPSTGMRGVLHALSFCDRVVVYGFRSSQESRRYHYWEPYGTKEYVAHGPSGSPHDMDHEHALLDAFAKFRRIHMCKKPESSTIACGSKAATSTRWSSEKHTDSVRRRPAATSRPA